MLVFVKAVVWPRMGAYKMKEIINTLAVLVLMIGAQSAYAETEY